MNRGQIIVLNGVSSSGKSSLSKELVKLLPNYFHLSIDDFDLVIDKMEDRDGGRLIPVPTEYFFHRTIQMFSDKGVNLIVDQILHNKETLDDFHQTLNDYPVLFVGVHCSKEELSRREKARGDRHSYLAASQLTFVHQQNEKYDVEVNTEDSTIKECAEKILAYVKK